MAKKLFIGLFILIILMLLGFLAGGLILPNTFEVQRSVTIEASPAEIHAYVGELRHWPAWSPWREADPDLEISLGDTTSGVGAEQLWKAREGDGRLVFTRSAADYGVDFELHLREGTILNTSRITYQPRGDRTDVTWWMGGHVPDSLFGGYLALMMDDAIGTMFQHGLANLARVVESGPPSEHAALQPEAMPAPEAMTPTVD